MLDNLRFSPSPTAHFVVNNCAALVGAAALLGGPGWEKRVRHLVDEMTIAPPLSRRLARELDALDALLALEFAHDLERPEGIRFAAIDPASPLVEEVCMLLEGLRGARSAEAADR